MANVEQSRNFGERSGDFFKRLGLVGAVIGAIGIIADWKFGGTLFVLGGGTAVAGYGLEKVSGSGKKK